MLNSMVKLVADIYYYVTSEGNVLFTDTSKKIFQSKAESLIWKSRDKIVKKGILKNNKGFSAKIQDGDIYVSNPKIQNGTWLKLIGKIKDRNIIDLAECCEIKDGVVAGNDLEVAFLEEDYNMIYPYLVKPKTPSYERAWEEFVRNTNILLHKKTKVLEVGHRYDMSNGTFWYLGEFSVPDNPKSSNYTKKKGFVSGLKKKDSTIEEILENVNKVFDLEKLSNTRFIDTPDNVLILSETTGSMVDSGLTLKEVQKPIDIVDLWEKWINKCDTTNIGDYIDLLYRTSGSGVHTGLTNIANKVSSVLEDFIFGMYVVAEGRSFGGVTLHQDSIDYDDFRKFFKYIWPGTNYSFSEAENVFKILGISSSINKIFDKVVERFGKIDFDNFDNFYKYRKRFMKLDRSLSISSEIDDDSKLRCKIQSPLILGAVKDLIELAKDSLELSRDNFDYLGVYQSNKNQVPNISLKISLENVIDYLGGVDALSDMDKAEILTEKFTSIDLSFKRTTKFI